VAPRPLTLPTRASYTCQPESGHAALRLRLVLTDLAGTVRHSAATPPPPDFTPGTLLTELTAGVGRITGAHDVAGRLTGVGLGMIGPLDHAQGTVRDAHRLRHWHDVPLRELAERALGLPVHLDKDVTAGVTAEAWRRGCLEAVHDRAAEAGDVREAARVLAVGVVNLLQTLDVAHVVLAGADLLAHAGTYRAEVEEAVVPRSPEPTGRRPRSRCRAWART